jgi:hypothetical protein
MVMEGNARVNLHLWHVTFHAPVGWRDGTRLLVLVSLIMTIPADSNSAGGSR